MTGSPEILAAVTFLREVAASPHLVSQEVGWTLRPLLDGLERDMLHAELTRTRAALAEYQARSESDREQALRRIRELEG